MRYIPVLTFVSEDDAAFEIYIISKVAQRQVGIGSTLFLKTDNEFEMVQCEYYVPEQFTVNEKEVETECRKFLEAMNKIQKMTV